MENNNIKNIVLTILSVLAICLGIFATVQYDKSNQSDKKIADIQEQIQENKELCDKQLKAAIDAKNLLSVDLAVCKTKLDVSIQPPKTTEVINKKPSPTTCTLGNCKINEDCTKFNTRNGPSYCSIKEDADTGCCIRMYFN